MFTMVLITNKGTATIVIPANMIMIGLANLYNPNIIQQAPINIFKDLFILYFIKI